MKKALCLILALSLSLFAFAACSSPEPSPTPTPSVSASMGGSSAVPSILPSATESANASKTIGVSLLTKEHVFWNSIEDGLKKYAADAGYNLIIQDGKGDSNVQYGQVQNFIAEKVDAILIAPADSGATETSVKMAKDAGIPVFFINISGAGEYTGFVGTDETMGGKLAGEYAVKALDGKGTCAIISYDEIATCVLRAEGFKSVIEQNPDMKVIASQTYSGDTNKAASITQNYLTQFPDLDLIFAVGDPAAVGAAEVIKTQKSKVKVIGYDGNPESITAIMSGDDIWIADVAQDPDSTAKGVIDCLNKHFSGQSFDKDTLIAPYIIDKAYIQANDPTGSSAPVPTLSSPAPSAASSASASETPVPSSSKSPSKSEAPTKSQAPSKSPSKAPSSSASKKPS